MVGQVADVLLALGRVRVVLVHEQELHYLLLLVRRDGDERFLVVGHGEVRAGCGGFGHTDGAEHFLYLALDAVGVNVAHHNDALQVGAVPLLVVVAQGLVGEVVHHLHGADGQAVGILAVFEEHGEHFFVHAHHGSHAGAPLLVDDAALLVNLLRVEGQGVGPVVQDE